MARLLGVEIPNEKRIEASLPYVYGIGPVTARRLLEQAGIDPNLRTGELTEDQLGAIGNAIKTSNVMIEGDRAGGARVGVWDPFQGLRP